MRHPLIAVNEILKADRLRGRSWEEGPRHDVKQFDPRTGKALPGPVRPKARLIMLPTHVEDGTLVYVYDGNANDARTVSSSTTKCGGY
jgi:hypothetical protein